MRYSRCRFTLYTQVRKCLGANALQAFVQPGVTGREATAAGVQAGDELLTLNNVPVDELTRADIATAFSDLALNPTKATFSSDAHHGHEAGTHVVTFDRRPLGFNISIGRQSHRQHLDHTREATEVRVSALVGGRAAKQGLQVGDVITRINGASVGTMTRNTIALHLKSDTLPIKLHVLGLKFDREI